MLRVVMRRGTHAFRDRFHQLLQFVDAAAFFAISRKEAICLFSGQARVSPQDVIQCIDALLGKYVISNQETKHAASGGY
jgi:hypothetical protein